MIEDIIGRLFIKLLLLPDSDCGRGCHIVLDKHNKYGLTTTTILLQKSLSPARKCGDEQQKTMAVPSSTFMLQGRRLGSLGQSMGLMRVIVLLALPNQADGGTVLAGWDRRVLCQ